MRGYKLLRGALGLLIAVLVLAACGSGRNAQQAEQQLGEKLGQEVILPPVGYVRDTTKGATGIMTAAVFDQVGGAGTAAGTGFVVGYKQNYVDSVSPEGITVTLIRFRSARQATAYFNATAPDTLSFAAATRTPFAQIPGAFSYAGTREYAGEYAHGVAMTRGRMYALVVYVNALPGTPPLELIDWAKGQYLRLPAN